MSDKPGYEDWQDEALLHEFQSLSISVFVGKYAQADAVDACGKEILSRMKKCLACKESV